jgi:hypothetical protein
LHESSDAKNNNADDSLSPFSTGRVQEIDGPGNGPFCFLAILFRAFWPNRQPQRRPAGNGAAVSFRDP